MLDPDLPRLLRLDPAAKLIAPDLSGRALREELKARGLPVSRIRNRLYVDQATIAELIRECRESQSLPDYISDDAQGESRATSSGTGLSKSRPTAERTGTPKRRRTSHGTCTCAVPIRAPVGGGRFQCLECFGTIEKRGCRG